MSNFNFIQIVLAIVILSNIGDAAVFQRQDRLNKCPELTGKLDLDYNQVFYIFIQLIQIMITRHTSNVALWTLVRD